MVVVAVVAGVLALLSRATGLLNSVERQSVDTRFAVRGSQTAPRDIVIVALDDASLQSFNVQLPIPRSYYARLIDVVRSAGPRLIGLDVQFNGASTRPEDDEALLAAISRDGPILLSVSDTGQGPPAVPAGAPSAPGAVEASGAVDTDADGVLRRMMYAQVTLKTFAIRAAELLRATSVGERHLPHNHAFIDFRGPPGTFRTYSFADVLNGRVPSAALAGKAVLVGVTAPIAKDVFVTAASSNPMAGVEVHANALATVLDGFPLRPVSWPIDVVLVLMLCTLPAIMTVRLSSLTAVVASLGALGAFMVCTQLAFNAGWIVRFTDPTMGLILSSAAVIAVDAFIARRQVAALETALEGFLRPAKAAFFISYRRDQGGFVASSLRAVLAGRFGESSVFMDTTAIKPGQDWPREIQEAILGCSAMLALIGPYWASATTGDGKRRLDDPADWVRLEIEAGLRRPEVAVVPVLIDGASIPDSTGLPDSLKPLTSRNAFVLTGDNLRAEVDGLVSAMHQARLRELRSAAPSASAQEPT